MKIGVQGQKISVGGPMGNLTLDAPSPVSVKWNESEKSIVVSIPDSEKQNAVAKALWGSTRAHLKNMVTDVLIGDVFNDKVDILWPLMDELRAEVAAEKTKAMAV